MATETRALSFRSGNNPFDEDDDEEAGGNDDESDSDLESPSSRSRLFPLIMCIGIIGIGALCYYFGRHELAEIVRVANREELPKGMEQCLVYGDPHVATYDQTKPEPSFHGSGEYWLSRTALNGAVLIQGQFSAAAPGKARSALTRLAVSGSFIRGRTIIIGTLQSGDILMDGQPILHEFPSAYFLPSGVGALTYNDVGVYVDTDTFGWEKHVVTMRFTRGVSLSVFRWNDFLDVRIRMPGGVPVKGVCGDNNGFGEDDSAEAIYSRAEVRVPEDESLFQFHVPLLLSPEAQALLNKCTQANLKLAEDVCQDISGEGRQQCYIDICFGTEEHEHTEIDESDT